MKKFLFAFISICIIISNANTSAAIGDWQTYLAYYNIQNIVPAGENIYVLSSNNLFSYNTDDESITEYNKVANLNDTNIRLIAYCKGLKRLIVIYANSNIDLISDDGEIINISDIYSKSMTEDKTIYNVDVYGNFAYLSTGFGVVKLNVRDAEISETYKFGEKISTVAVYKNKIYASVDYKYCYIGNNNDNLIDKANWVKSGNYAPSQFFLFNNELLGYIKGEVYHIDENANPYGKVNSIDIAYYSFNDDRLLFGNNAKVEVFDGKLENKTIWNIKDEKKTTCLVYDKKNKAYWRDITGGFLSSAVEYEGDLMTTPHAHKPESPKYNNFGFLKFYNGKLYTCGAGFSGEAELLRPAAVQVLNEDDSWQIYQDNIDTITGYQFVDANALDIDPTNPSRVITGGRTGLYEYLDGKFVRAYNNEKGSPLQTASTVGNNNKNYVITQAVKFGANGHLWCFNSIAPSMNLLEHVSDTVWKNHFDAQLMFEKDRSLENVVSMIFDSRGYLWFCNNHWNKPSLYCYIPSEDELISYTSFINEDGTNVAPTYVRCVAEDKSGNIWIGTNAGPIYLPENEFFATRPVFQQVKVPRNDGTDNADYLLSGLNINGIVVDDADRKWFATSSSGVFEIGVDNMTQINNFTVENSPLLSNNVESIAYSDNNGKLYFGTENGLCSYISDTSKPEPVLDNNNIYAYPNPVTSDYNGLITIVGLTLNAQVKIVTSAGYVVAEGRSTGGTFTWNGCDKGGKRVASGVYMVLATTSEGKTGAVCKIAMIK